MIGSTLITELTRKRLYAQFAAGSVFAPVPLQRMLSSTFARTSSPTVALSLLIFTSAFDDISPFAEVN